MRPVDETSEYPVIYGLYIATVMDVWPQPELRQVSVNVAVVPVKSMVNKSDPLDAPNSMPEPMTAVPFVLLLPYPGGTAPVELSRKFAPLG